MRRWLRGHLLVAVLAIGAIAAAAGVWYAGHDGGSSALRTAPVNRGDLTATIGATGTLEPEEVIDVGAQVAGRIVSFGLDKNHKPIDYGSVVEKGTVLAKIDDSVYSAGVAQSQAQLEQSKAAVVKAEADLGQMKAKLLQAQSDWSRAQELQKAQIISQSDFDAARAAFEIARSNVAVAEASIVEARKVQAQSAASLDKAKQDLARCTIESPVEGVIIDRRVNIGQTVVASLNAPSLFLIAKDLKRMQVWVSVNEADIGSVKAGQPVTFTVDAHPGEVFRGVVNKIRLNAAMTQNVVTYTVEVRTDNSDERLVPYLTANVQFEIEKWTGVLMVPNAALRWEPRVTQAQTASRGERGDDAAAAVPARRGPGDTGGPGDQAPRYGTIWVVDDAERQKPRPVRVRLGASDGVSTIVEAADLKEGQPVVLGEAAPGADQPAAGTNPFAPPARGRSRGGGQAGTRGQ